MGCSTPSPVCQDPNLFWDLQLAGTKETHIVDEVGLESPPSSDGALVVLDLTSSLCHGWKRVKSAANAMSSWAIFEASNNMNNERVEKHVTHFSMCIPCETLSYDRCFRPMTCGLMDYCPAQVFLGDRALHVREAGNAAHVVCHAGRECGELLLDVLHKCFQIRGPAAHLHYVSVSVP
jgi:hypothetical protein